MRYAVIFVVSVIPVALMYLLAEESPRPEIVLRLCDNGSCAAETDDGKCSGACAEDYDTEALIIGKNDEDENFSITFGTPQAFTYSSTADMMADRDRRKSLAEKTTTGDLIAPWNKGGAGAVMGQGEAECRRSDRRANESANQRQIASIHFPCP